MGVNGYHVNVKECIRPDNSVEWRDIHGDVQVTENFLPLDRPARIGITSGASTPDSVVQECLERIVLVKKLGAAAASDGEGGEGDGAMTGGVEEREGRADVGGADGREAAGPGAVAMGPPPAGFEWSELF